MTVDITQEEMNILNLNGITAEEVRDNIQYMRGTGLDDKTIRTQYSETIKQLRPITKLSPNDTARIKDMQKKGAITPFEYASRKAVEYNGTYNNVDKYANLNLTPEQKAKREQNDKEYQQRINDMEQIKLEKQAESERIRAERKAKNAERDARVNNGTASFLDRVGAYLDRQADISARVSASTPALDPVLIMAGVDNTGEPLHPSKYDKTKPINAHESVAKSFMSGGWIPFAGGFIENADKKKAREIKEHIINNEPIREDELKFYNRYLDNLQEESARGYTLGGKITHDFLNSLVRFGGEIATGGWVLKSLGGVTELAEGASLAEKAAHGIKSMAATGAVNTVLPTTWNDTYANYQNRRFDKEFELTDKGTWLLKEAEEKPAISFLKSLGQTFVMFASEASGELLKIPVEGVKGAAGKYVGTPISKYLASNPKLIKFIDNTIPALSKAYEKLNNLPVKGKSLDWLKNAVKFDGFIEEMGEEVVEDIMNITLGTTDEKRTLENYAKAIFKSPDEWAVIAGAVALQGGTLSAASHVLGSYMERNGASDEEIIETLNNLSEGEKEQKIQELISENLINVSEYTNEESEKKSQLKDAYFNQIKKTGMDDNDALSNAELMSEAFAALAKNTGMNLDDVTNEANIVIQNMSDEQAQRMYEADNSAALNGRVVFNDSQLIDDELQKVYDDFSALPEDYSDEADVNNRIQQMQILQDIKDGDLAQEQQQAAQDLIAQYEQTNPQLAAVLRKAVESKQNTTNDANGINEVEFQKIDRNNIESAFGDTVENIQETVKADVMNILQENGIDESEFNFEDIRIFGSYSTGKNKKGSDLDLLVQYSGDMREDDAFNMLNAKKLSIYDKNGKKVKIDINPINVKDSGTIDEHLEYLNKLEPKFQKIDTAGAENNQTALARQEWKNKGTESRFFKKWFGNSKVVDKNGKPLVVSHGTNADFEKFEIGDIGYHFGNMEQATERMTDFSDGNPHIMSGYLKMENPLDIVSDVGDWLDVDTVKEYLHEYEILSDEEFKKINTLSQITSLLQEKGYDGVIYENQYEGKGKSYIVFNSSQFKSVDNQGTFDENNPNIYYQSAAMKRSKFADFEDFYNDVISKPKNTKNKEQFNYLTKGGINLRIPHDTILHEQKKHKLSSDEWKDLLGNIDDVSDAALSKKKSRFDGKPVLLKVNTLTDTYGVVLETFEKSNPIIATAFIDSEKNIDNWIKNEAISSGTKTSFLSNRLNNIITNIHPKFKSYNVQAYFQSAYHGTPHRFDEFSTDNIGTGEGAQAHGWGLYFAADKNVSEEYRRKLSGDRVFYDGQELEKPYVYTHKIERGEDKETNRYLGDLRYIIDRISEIKSDKNISIEDAKKEFIKTYQQKGKLLAFQRKILDIAKNIDTSKIDIQKGQLFEVDIPEDDVLLDEDKNFREQPEQVRKAIIDLAFGEKIPISYFANTTGKDIYNRLRKHLYDKNSYYNPEYNASKAASETLNKYGIKGITYDGRRDGRCYVIFDDKAISALKTYYQGMDDMNSNINNARGFTYQRKNFDGTEKENLIVLLNKKVDKSTLMHEFAHVYLITLNNLAQHNDKAKELLMQVNKWLHYDGVEYTEFQHERFANHFVAYVATGRAPSYGLKKVFENFRRWLNDMYSALQAADDVWIDPEAEELFEKLLGDISINAQKQEAEQILNKAHNNAIRRYNDKLEQLKQKYKKNQLTEYQKRYRDAALSIVHYALTNSRMPEAKKYQNYNQLQMILLATSEYKRKSKGVAKQQEEIGEILAELDDVFSANDGFMAGWSEFFTDTGVSYDNQEVNADAELATRAFEVLVSGEYAQATPDYIGGEYGDLTEEEKAQTEFELEYIIEEYKNADDKTVPLLAYNEWSKKVHPYIEEDMQKEWERQTNEIDRYQALNKFEQAKEDLKLYAATLKGQGDYSAQFAEYARAIVKRLDFMTENDKAKLFDKLKEFNSFREIERNLDDVMDYAQTLADVSDRRALSEQIDREVKQTIHVWQNGIKKTKYTYPANKLFERLREINKMSVSAVQEMYDAIVNEEEQPDYTSDTVHDKEYYSLLEELFIKYKINGIYYNSTEFLQDLLEKLQTAKYTAKIARDEIDFERRMKQLNLVDECAKAVNERKDEIKERPQIKKIGKLNSLGFNFNGALKMIFNDKIKNWASFDYLYAKRDAQVGKDRREFLEKAKKIFGYDGKLGDVKLFNRFIDMTQKYYKINQRHSPDIEQGSYRVTQQSPETGFNATQYTQQVRQDIDFAQEWKPIETELSKMEVLYFYIQAKNPTSYVILTDKDKGQFDKYEFDTMLDSLTEQEKMLGDVMQLAAEKYWNGLNAYHIKKYHTELGKVKGYFPRLSELSEVKMLDMFNDYVNQSSTGKFQKQRTAGAGTRIATANALAVLFDHIEKANTVIIMGEHMDEVNRVFTNPDLKRLIENTWGDDVTREFYGQLAGNLFTAQTLTKSLQEKWYGSIISNLIKANIFFKPQIGFKQLISFMNYGKGDEYVSAAEWWAKFMKQTLTPSQWKKNIEFMMENDYLKDRFGRGGSMDALKKELDTRYFSKMSLLDEFWGLPVAVGDISAIILGGKPYIDVLMEKGYTKEQAFRIFIETTVNDQQSSIPSTLSNMQRNAAQSPLAKMAFAYQNTPWQYYRQCTSAIMKAVQSGEKPDIQRAAKMTLLYGWLFPAMFNMASSLSLLTAMGGGGDDDLLSDINPLRTITSVLTQHPILGQWINGILNAAEGKPFNSQDLLSKHISNVNKLIRHFKKGEVTLQDLWNSIAAFGESTTGTPLSSMGNAASGVYDVIQGDVAKGALKVLGYTDYRAKKVTGEE